MGYKALYGTSGGTYSVRVFRPVSGVPARPCTILQVRSTETPEKFCLFRIWFRGY